MGRSSVDADVDASIMEMLLAAAGAGGAQSPVGRVGSTGSTGSNNGSRMVHRRRSVSTPSLASSCAAAESGGDDAGYYAAHPGSVRCSVLWGE
jgi:hypothetical protein